MTTDSKLHLLDIGTGSGCIAISLKDNLHGSQVTGLDISKDALCIAKANAEKHKLDIVFIHADILDQNQWEQLPEYDVIISNPPYVTHAEKSYMLPNVINFEPHIALFVPDEDPLLYFRYILLFAKTRLRDGGTLWFEINEAYADELKQLSLDQGFKDVNIIFDIHGKSRFLHSRK
jgi:release factor glutamine methyltransferase